MSRPLVDWAVATKKLAGQTQSGDRHVVRPFPGGTLVAALDGLGHGEEAAAAARTAARTLERYPQESVISLLRRCHEGLRGTRGVAMSVASFSARDGTLTWVGVGNVEGILRRADAGANPASESLLLRGGVVGGQLPLLYASIVPVMRGDTLLLFTDGLRSGFDPTPATGETPQQMADRILARHAKGSDDALVLVARYAGEGL